MRLFLSLLIVGLFGCPAWDAEREQRCRELDASTGVCVTPGIDAGAVDAGVSDGGMPDAGAIDAGESVLDITQMAIAQRGSLIHSFGTDVRVPVLVWEAPIPGPIATVATVEASDGATTVWRSESTGSGQSPQDWCASAVNDQSTLVGFATIYGVSTDDMDAGDYPASNRNYRLSGCASALAEYQRGDGGISFLGVFNDARSLRVERTSPDANAGPELSFSVSLLTPRVGEATTDGEQRTWISAATGDGIVAVEVARDGVAGVAHTISAFDGGARVDLSSSGTALHAAWLDDDRLWLASMNDGGSPQLQSWRLSGGVRLVDLVENPNSVVVVLEYPVFNGAAILIHDAVGDTFFRIQTAGQFWFRPTAAHLRQTLRLAGQCLSADGGPGGSSDAGCRAPSANPLMNFSQKPDGGAW